MTKIEKNNNHATNISFEKQKKKFPYMDAAENPLFARIFWLRIQIGADLE